MTRRVLLALAAVAFSVAATANSGGYRYGASDQAFYTVAVLKQLHPDYFPRDTPLIRAESRFMASDRIIAGVSSALHVDLPPLYLTLYALTLVLLFGGAIAFGRAAGFSSWALAAFAVLLTFRHQITHTAANSLEGYMHPRMLAFAIGVWALACVVRMRYGRAMAWTILATCWHPTTGVWFGLVVGVAAVAGSPRWRPWLGAAAALAVCAAAWALVAGPLAGRLVVMDPAWLKVLEDKDYLFPHEWPLSAWAINLATAAAAGLIYRRRVTRGVATPGEGPFLLGLCALLAVLLVALPFTTMRIALAVQLQATRVFWVIDFAAAAYIAWWLVDDAGRSHARWRVAIVVLLAAASTARGVYLLSQDRHLVSVTFPQSPWVDVLQFLRTQPVDTFVLADPMHAWRYGLSARLVAERDTFVEIGKDSALAMYDRDIAMRVGERLAAAADFGAMTAPQIQALGRRYGLTVVVVELARPLALPELYRNKEFVVYKL